MAKLNPEELLMAERVFSTKELAEIAQYLGWNHERTKGSHQIFSRVGWKENLSIPVHREYEWGVAKGVLQKILAPIRDQVPEHELMLQTLENSLSRLRQQALIRITAYENKKMEEADLLLQEAQNSFSTLQDLELCLNQQEEELQAKIQQIDAQKSEYEERLRYDNIQKGKEIETFRRSLQESSVESNQLNQQVDQLRRERDRLRKAQTVERMIAGVGLGILSAIALGAILTRFQCEPAQKSLSPPLGSQPQRTQ